MPIDSLENAEETLKATVYIKKRDQGLVEPENPTVGGGYSRPAILLAPPVPSETTTSVPPGCACYYDAEANVPVVKGCPVHGKPDVPVKTEAVYVIMDGDQIVSEEPSTYSRILGEADAQAADNWRLLGSEAPPVRIYKLVHVWDVIAEGTLEIRRHHIPQRRAKGAK